MIRTKIFTAKETKKDSKSVKKITQLARTTNSKQYIENSKQSKRIKKL